MAKPKGFGSQPVAEPDDENQCWVIKIPYAEAYTWTTAAKIIASSYTYLSAHAERYEGPNSTEEYPVDHAALVRYQKLRMWREARTACRREVARRLGALLRGGVKCS